MTETAEEVVWVPRPPTPQEDSCTPPGGTPTAVPRKTQTHACLAGIIGNGSFLGDVVYSSATPGPKGTTQPLRKLSFRHGGMLSNSGATTPCSAGDRSRSPAASADFGWYEMLEEEGGSSGDECDGVWSGADADDEAGLLEGQLHTVDVIARWHEVGSHVARADAAARAQARAAAAAAPDSTPAALSTPPGRVLRRVLIRDYVISTRSFEAPRPPAAAVRRGSGLLSTGGGGMLSGSGGSRHGLRGSGGSVGSASALAALQDEKSSSGGGGGAPVCFAWAIPEIRIVVAGSGKEHAEYLVVGCLGDTLLTSWRRYSDLIAWAQQAKELKFSRAVEAWEGVMGGKRIWRCLDPSYLRMKSHNLEQFLQQLLFEVSSYTELLAFFDTERACSQGPGPQEDPIFIQPLARLPMKPSHSLTAALAC